MAPVRSHEIVTLTSVSIIDKCLLPCGSSSLAKHTGENLSHLTVGSCLGGDKLYKTGNEGPVGEAEARPSMAVEGGEVSLMLLGRGTHKGAQERSTVIRRELSTVVSPHAQTPPGLTWGPAAAKVSGTLNTISLGATLQPNLLATWSKLP